MQNKVIELTPLEIKMGALMDDYQPVFEPDPSVIIDDDFDNLIPYIRIKLERFEKSDEIKKNIILVLEQNIQKLMKIYAAFSNPNDWTSDLKNRTEQFPSSNN